MDSRRACRLLKSFSGPNKDVDATESSNKAGVKTQTNVYDMIRGPASWQYYRKQVSRDGNPLTDQENKEQDRRHQTFEETVRASLSRLEGQSEEKKQEDANAYSGSMIFAASIDVGRILIYFLAKRGFAQEVVK